jgi:transcriptional regulator with XRE-family HTH domain
MLFSPRPRTTGELIRLARKRRGWSVPRLAGELGVAAQTVYRWEWDACRVTDKKLQLICLLLSCPIGTLRGKPRKAATT